MSLGLHATGMARRGATSLAVTRADSRRSQSNGGAPGSGRQNEFSTWRAEFGALVRRANAEAVARAVLDVAEHPLVPKTERPVGHSLHRHVVAHSTATLSELGETAVPAAASRSEGPAVEDHRTLRGAAAPGV